MSEHYHILAVDGKIVFAIRLGLDGQGNVVSSRVVKKPDEISADIEAWLQSIDV
jgi:hypothetical protein